MRTLREEEMEDPNAWIMKAETASVRAVDIYRASRFPIVQLVNPVIISKRSYCL